MRLPSFDSQAFRPQFQLSVVLAVTAAANALTAAFTIFHLLSGWLPPEGAAAYVALIMVGAGCGAVILAFTPLGRTDARSGITAGLACLAIFYSLLSVLDAAPRLAVPLSALAFGAYIFLFFVPFNSAALQLTTAGNRAGLLGALGLVFPVVATAMPMLGGAMISMASFQAAALVSLALVGAAMAYTLRRGVLASAMPVAVGRGFADCVPRRTAVGFWSQGLFDGAIWTGLPIIGYSVVTSVGDYGLLLSLSSLFGALAALAMGRASDRARRRLSYFYPGLAILLPGVLVGLAVPGLTGFAVSLALLNFGIPIVGTFLFAMAGDAAFTRPGELSYFREVLLSSGRFAAALVLIPLGGALGWLVAPFVVLLAASAGMAVGRVAVGLERSDQAAGAGLPAVAAPLK